MLEYEWVTGNEGGATTEPDQNHHHHHHQTLNHNYTFLQEPNYQFSTPTLTSSTIDFSHYHLFNFNPQQNHPFFHPRAFHSASSSSFPTLQPPMFSLNQLNRTRFGPGPGPGLIPVSKPEHGHWPVGFSGLTGLGLNLGRQTYFRSSSDDFVNHRPNLVEPPRCQAQGCNADLSDSKHYHRRHKVCEFHSKAATVVAAGLTQRFCQQCSRFHLLSEFDNGKRSCRKRLADHNRRRRKTQHQTQENHFG